MRARYAPAAAAALLSIALTAPDLPVAAPAVAADITPAPTSERATPMARGMAREPAEDLAAFVDSATLSESFASAIVAASRAQPVLPTPTEDAERRMLALINASRAAAGLAPLKMDQRAAVAARGHSAVESRFGYVYHDGADGTAASRNVPACGTGWYGENTGKIWRGNVDALHIEFMSEPWVPINHRTNIMDGAFRRIGIGAVEGRDALYMTMVFCR